MGDYNSSTPPTVYVTVNINRLELDKKALPKNRWKEVVLGTFSWLGHVFPKNGLPFPLTFLKPGHISLILVLASPDTKEISWGCIEVTVEVPNIEVLIPDGL